MGALDNAAAFVEVRLSTFFRHVGYFIADRPYSCITASIILAAILSSGVVLIESESRARELYAPKDNIGQKDLDLASQLFAGVQPEEKWNRLIAFTEDGRNLNTVEVLNSLYALMQDLRKVTAELDGETFSYEDFCPKSVQKGFENECQFIGVTDLMDGPITDESQKPVVNPLFGADKRGLIQITPLFAGGRELSADESRVEKVEAWKFKLDLLDGEEGPMYTKSSALAHAMFVYLEERTKEQTNSDPYMLAYEFYFSEAEELDKSTNSDIGLLSVTFTMVITFSFLVVRSYSDFVLSKGNVVWGAQLGIVLAIGSAFGVMGFAGVKFNPVVATTSFLLLGLGIDDAFVLIQAYHIVGTRLGPEATVRDRMGATFESAGVSILFTSLTDVMAFAVGASSLFPAVVGFCAYTATGVAFDFLFQCSLFGAVLAIDSHREYCGVKEWRALCGDGWLRNDKYSPSKNLIKPNGEGPPGGKIPIMPEVAYISRVMKAYGEALLTPMASAAVLLAFAGYAAFAIYGTLHVGTGLDIRDLAPSDSYWLVYVDQNFNYFQEQGPSFKLVFPPGSIDWIVAEDRAKAAALVHDLEQLTCIFSEPRGNWLSAMSQNSSLDVAALEGAPFIAALRDFLAGPGFEYQRDVLLDIDNDTPASTAIMAAQMTLRIEPLTTTSGDAQGVPCIKANREAIAEWVKKNGFEDRAAPVVSADQFPFWDGSAVIVEQTARNLAYAALCCFIMTLLILPHPVLCISAMAVVASILAGVVASMALILDLRIETISMINLVLAIGFSIDNVAHYCHAYMVSRAPTRRKKAIAALELIGVPILLGDASTMLALLPLTGSKSQIFRSFFQILFSVLLLGALHAVVLLPVVLGLIGPLPEYAETKRDEESGHNAEEGKPVEGNGHTAREMQIEEKAENGEVKASQRQTEVLPQAVSNGAQPGMSSQMQAPMGMMDPGPGGMMYMQQAPGMAFQAPPGMMHPATMQYGMMH